MGRTLRQVLSLCVFATLVLASCSKDGKTTEPNNSGQVPPVNNTAERRVYVACEGSFGSGNASLSMQELTSFTTYNDVYFKINSKSLGDVLQSVQRIGDKLFLCVNNSDKVIVLDAKERTFIKTMDIPKPRYILPVNPQKAYVSTLYSNKLYVINPENATVSGTIDLPAQNPEGMTIQANRALICTWDTSCNKVYVVSILTDQVVDSYIISGYAPHSVVTDDAGFVWVLAGNVSKGKRATLTKLAPGSSDIIESFQFQDLQDPIKLTTNKAKNVLYYIGVDYTGNAGGYNGVFSMGVQDGKLPSAPLIPANKYQYYWGLGIDPVTEEIYVGDPKGFTQQGSVSVYSPAGQQKRTFKVGVGPGYFYFDE